MKKSLLSLMIIFGAGGLYGCGGSGSDSSSAVPDSTNHAPSEGNNNLPVIGENKELIKAISLFNSGIELTAADFALESWNPRSIASANHILYIANDSGTANILRYDLKNKKALPNIQAENISAIGSAWNRLYDLSIYKDRLYAASLSSNRVDVFDIATGEPQFIMSLGTGSWSGDQVNKAIVHALSVAANDQYVFAADIQNRINVWKQSDVAAGNHLKATKYARLALPGCSSTYCDVRLEAAGDFLYASMGDGRTYAYDLSLITEGASDIQPIKQESSLANIINFSDDGKVFAARTSGRIDQFKFDDIQNLTTILAATPSASYHNYKILGQSKDNKLAKSIDMVVANNQLLSLANAKITILPLTNLSQYQSNLPSENTVNLNLAAAVSQNKVLQDGESWETLTNYELRNFYVNRILSGTIEKNILNLQSYSATPVKDLELQVKMKGSNQWFVLAKLDELAAFSQAKFKLSIVDNQRYALADGAESIQFSGINNLDELPSDLFDIKIISKTDPHVQKLSSIKPVWNIAFGTYGVPAVSNWKPINPLYAREWVIMMTNFAYIISSPEFEYVWFHHKHTMGHDFFGNAGQVTGANGFFTEDEYKKYYAEIMNRSRIYLGITSMGGGLGGGTTLGIDTWYFYSHYFNADIGVIGHEFGHHWGSHDSAWANSSYGLQSINLQLHQYFQRKNQLPYMDPDLNKFHLAPKDQLYNGISESMRKPRPASNVNNLEKYFAEHPL